MSNKEWIRTSRELIYRAKTADEISFVRDRIRLPSQQEFDYLFVDCPYQVTYIVGIDPDQNVILINQYRYLVDRFIYEVPAGSPEPGESLEEGATRELKEESGCEVQRLIKLASFYSSVGITNQLSHVYIAFLSANQTDQRLDKSEIISVEKVAFERAVSMAEKGEILNVGAAYGILLAAAWMRVNS